MRIRWLRIRVNTDKGLFGTDIPFDDGLVILRAENSTGKSTCLKAILVALGMEAMLTANREDLPLPPVLKDHVHTDDGDAKVIESDIFLEVENRRKERIVVHRTVKGTRNAGLIEVTHGPALTNPDGRYQSYDFFVGCAGDMTRDLGFLRFLTEFLGWEVPIVRTFQNDDRPLYPQCIFPYFFVEQSRGWSSLEPPLPTRFGIKEMHKRTVEYLLKLDAIKIAAKRLEIEEEEVAVSKEWSVIVGGLKAIAKNIGGTIQRVPSSPIAIWPPEIPPVIMMPEEEIWISLDQKQKKLQVRLKEIELKEIPRVSEIVGSAENELAHEQERFNNRQAMLSRLLELYDVESDEIATAEKRLRKIEEDLQRNKDARTLLNFGGTAVQNIIEHRCPTCHQQLVDSLTPLAEGQGVMTIDENIRFLEEQRRIFKAVLVNQLNIVEARERQVSAIREEVSSLRSRIRTLKEVLVSDGRIPSIAAIHERVQLQETIKRIVRTADDFAIELGKFGELSARWNSLQKEKSRLPKEDISEKDREKINRWTELLREQLRQYDFKSLAVQDITVSGETYRPLHDGFDLPTNISASDFIRVIWSYINALREISLEYETNHPGLLIFDEPRQQSAKDISFEQLLKRAAKGNDSSHQIIFATSEKEETIKKMLTGIPHVYRQFNDYIIKQIFM